MSISQATSTSPSPFIWPPDDKDNCASWVTTIPVTRYLALYQANVPGQLIFPPEAYLSAFFLAACQQLGQAGSDVQHCVEINSATQLNNLHDDLWNKSVPHIMYHQCLDKAARLSPDLSLAEPGNSMASNSASTRSGGTGAQPMTLRSTASRSSAAAPLSASSSSNRSSSTTSGGPYKPDMTTIWTTDRTTHATLVMEIKTLNRKKAYKSQDWIKQHYSGLSQALWYLYAAHHICDTRMGLFLCNNRYQRIIIDEDGRFLIEVRNGSSSLELVNPGFQDCPMGEENIPNRLPNRTVTSPKDTQPRGSLFRLWNFVRSSLKIAEHCILQNRCPPSPPSVNNLLPTPDSSHVALQINAESLGPVLDGVNTFNVAKKALRTKQKTQAADQAKLQAKQPSTDGDGNEGAGGGQGQGGGQEGRGDATRKSRKRDDDGDGHHIKGRKKERTNADQSKGKGKERERECT
jgi:hypothetical protein